MHDWCSAATCHCCPTPATQVFNVLLAPCPPPAPPSPLLLFFLPSSLHLPPPSFKRGLLTEAALALEAEVRANPGNSEAWRLLGPVHAENDDDQQAIAAMGEAAGPAGGRVVPGERVCRGWRVS